jgi:formylglycine-generating enzyme
MVSKACLTLAEIEQRVCDVTSVELGIDRRQISPRSLMVEDLHCDSLDLIELFVSLEEEFSVTLPGRAPNPVYKTIFTRSPFRLSDLAELVYVQQGTGTPKRKGWRKTVVNPPTVAAIPFTQLDGRWQKEATSRFPPLEPLKDAGPFLQYRRRSDGMRCVALPAASVEIGCDAPDALLDEQPKHVAELDAFLIDAEPVSTTAYCRFLNSIVGVRPENFEDWFVLGPGDDRNESMLVTETAGEWRPVPETERRPMILVSWFGANAYSLWANGRDWRFYRDDANTQDGSFLPSEAQWEYAARGSRHQPFPWGDAPPSLDLMRCGRHRRSATYRADTLPMAEVNEPLGVSPFGLHHMAGNVWQWCRDWYDAGFYRRAEAGAANPLNRTPTRVRSERGGSWIGPAELCRSSYRRGRPAAARGRCLGFRCVSPTEDVR